MRLLNFNLSSISDIYVRQNFQNIQNLINNLCSVITMAFLKTSITLQDTQITHNLGFTPTDLIMTRFENSEVTIHWLYEKFDNNNLYFTLSGVPAGPTDTTKYGLNLLLGRLS